METGLRLVSPSCVHPDKEWMKAFMKGVEERKLRVDAVGVHSYGGPSAEALMKRLKTVHEMFGGRPLWITEFGVGDWQAKNRAENRHRPEQVAQFIRQLFPQLDACTFVERYAWFNTRPESAPLGPSALFNEDGTLTTVGEAYRTA
jgi:O-glycosyl hydrolase